ncbi:MAG: hypothetical protein BroJett014_02040 [Planctomycetota bacterium]|nr:hypothetical protein [Planctomycetota bacterium]GIK51231.1 MAG: hypothetical protein BroJett014_02040 [Planctomycetota bacterium]
MKKYILLAGVGFYFLTFMAIVGVAWLDVETDPDFHFVTNVITGERVKVFQYDELSRFKETEFAQALYYPMAAADLPPEKDRKPLEDKFAAWGAYQAALHNVSLSPEGKVLNTPSVKGGEELYKASVCWHCHSQFVRPFDYENRRWGPTAQIGEASWESPHYFATRRVGPDLLREGGLRTDDWHYAHFFNPKYTVPQSIMPPFGGISRYFVPLTQSDRKAFEDEIYAKWAGDKKYFNASDAATAEAVVFDFLKETGDEYKDRAWVLYKGRSGVAVGDIAPGSFPIVRVTHRPTQEMIDLVAYIQTRGTNIGTTSELVSKFEAWKNDSSDEARDKFLKYMRKKGFASGNWRIQPAVSKPTGEPDHVFAPAVAKVLEKIVDGASLTREEQEYWLESDAARYRLKAWRQSVKRGADLFGKKCVGCHGGLEDNSYANERYSDYLTLSTDFEYLEPSKPGKFSMVGNGYGPAARWLVPEPRNLTLSATLEKDGKIRKDLGYSTVYKYRSNERSDLPLPRDLFHTLRNGMPGSAMPAWPFMTDWEIWDLVNFVMYLGNNKAGRAELAELMKGAPQDQIDAGITDYYSLKAVQQSFANRVAIPAIPKKDEAGNDVTIAYLEKRGEEIYKKKRDIATKTGGKVASQCMDCHGSEGDGWGGKRVEIINRMGIPARNFWVGQFKLGSSAEDIYLTLYNGIAGTSMNKQNDGWTDLDAWSVVYYVRKMARLGVTQIEGK